jgi:hypothetical protein
MLFNFIAVLHDVYHPVTSYMHKWLYPPALPVELGVKEITGSHTIKFTD